MASSSTHEISPEGLRTLRQNFIVRKWGEAFMFQVVNCSFVEGNTLSISGILDNKRISIGKKPTQFSQSEVDNLSSNDPSKMDITLLHKTCRIFWEKGVKDPGDRLKNIMKKLKDMRNEVCHEKSKMTQDQLKEKLNEIEIIFQEATDEASVQYSCHGTEFQQMKTDIGMSINRTLENIREGYNPSNPEDRKKIEEELEEYGDKLCDCIRDKLKLTLVICISQQCKTRPYDMLVQDNAVDPSMFSVPLMIDTEEHFNSQQTRDIKTKTYDQKDILEIKDVNDKYPQVNIVSGIAGAGKTTLLCSVGEKWQKEETEIFGLTSYEMVFYVEFRNNHHDSLEKYLCDTFPQEISAFSYSHVRSTVLLSKCLILYDGYDERNGNSSKLFQEILSLNWKNMRMIVTTRPGNIEDLTNIVKNYNKNTMNFSVLGLKGEQMQNLTENLINHLVNDGTEREKMNQEITDTLKSMTSKMKEILENPLYFNLYVRLHIECPDIRGSITTVSNLYEELNKYRRKRLVVKLELEDEEKVLEFEELYQGVSSDYYFKGIYELQEVDIRDFRKYWSDLGFNPEIVLPTYLNVKYSRRGLDHIKIYCYRHLTEQEYVVAKSVCEEIEKNQDERSELNSIPNEITDKISGRSVILHFIIDIMFEINKPLLCQHLEHFLDLFTQDSKSEIELYGNLLIDKQDNDLYYKGVISYMRKAVEWKPDLNINKGNIHRMLPLLPEVPSKRILVNYLSFSNEDQQPLKDLAEVSYNTGKLLNIDASFINREFTSFSKCLHRLKGLTSLNLTLMGLTDIPSPVTYPDTLQQFDLEMWITTRNPDFVADVTNIVCPKAKIKEKKLRLFDSNFTKKEIERLINAMKIKHFNVIEMEYVESDAIDAEEELEKLCQRREIAKTLTLDG